MTMPFSATELLAELPRLRRYARILTDDPERADRLVEATLLRCRQMQGESAGQSIGPRSTQLLALLRTVSAEQPAPGTRREPSLGWLFAWGSNSSRDQAATAGSSLPDRGEQMLAQLRELPLEQREVLVLVAVERMSYVEVAALLHIPAATVIARLSQAREALRSVPLKPQSAPKNAS
jgi:RNA polymerase sigma-70 factor (ECF subfamily)